MHQLLLHTQPLLTTQLPHWDTTVLVDTMAVLAVLDTMVLLAMATLDMAVSCFEHSEIWKQLFHFEIVCFVSAGVYGGYGGLGYGHSLATAHGYGLGYGSTIVH